MTLTDCANVPCTLQSIPLPSLSRHAWERLQERAIPTVMIPLLRSYGHPLLAPSGHRRWQFTAREFGQMQQDVSLWLAGQSAVTDLPCLRHFLAYFTAVQIKIGMTYRFHLPLDPATQHQLHTELALILPNSALRRTTLIESRDGQVVTLFYRQRKTSPRMFCTGLSVAA